jgi:cytosine/adenosine deaminase-related metal-dependent hydrolase
VLHAATLGSAQTIGRQSQLGSLTPGKLADLIVLDENPLAAITNTSSIRAVMKNGRLYDAGTLAQLWPEKTPPPPRWFASGEKSTDAVRSPLY